MELHFEKQLEAIDEKPTLTSSPLIGVNAPKGATLTATLTSANGTQWRVRSSTLA